MQPITLIHWRTTLIRAAQLGLTVSITVWLALFAPMLCQYHGLMWNHTHMDEMIMEDAGWDDPQPALDMSGMKMTADEHRAHLRQMAVQHTAPESPVQQVQPILLHRAVLPTHDVSSTNSLSLYNPVPSVATMLVSIMLIHAPAHVLAAARENAPTRLHPESADFPLQLAIPPLEQPPRC